MARGYQQGRPQQRKGNQVKYFFVDTECTGVDPKKNGVIQIAGRIVINGKVVERFDIRAKPFPDDVIEDEALAVNGITREQMETFQAPREAYRQLTAILSRHCDKFKRSDKFHFVGYFGDFDANMIRSWFEKNNDVYFGSWFWSPILDVAKLAGVRLMEKRHQMINFKLLTVATWLGLDVDPTKAHDADYDIDLTMRVFKLCIQDLAFLEVQMET